MSNKKYNTEKERKEAKRIKQEEYYNKNKEKIKIKDRERHLKNNKVLNEEEKEEKRIYAKSYRVLNSDKIKLYYIKNKEELRIKQRLYQNNKLKTDIQYKLKHNLRTLIRNTFKNNGYTKNSKTNDILGCSYEYFKLYLESKFEPWMTWENRGLYNGELNYGWDIDHIIPLDSSVTENDIITLNHYTNLQPLCSYTNRNIKKNN